MLMHQLCRHCATLMSDMESGYNLKLLELLTWWTYRNRTCRNRRGRL